MITINVPGDSNAEVARELEEALNLRRAVVIDDPEGDEDTLLAQLGEAAIEVLGDVVREGDRVGIASTRTMLAIHEAPRVALPRCTFLQLTGEIPREDAANVMGVIRILTRRAAGSAKVFYAPMIAGDEGAWRSYMAPRRRCGPRSRSLRGWMLWSQESVPGLPACRSSTTTSLPRFGTRPQRRVP